MNEEKKVPFKWEYGEETISLQLGMYANNQRLYIGMVDQDVFLFDDTIRENIRHARPEATDEEIEAACREANCGGFIRKMEKGYDTPTGENGNLLSGGERQRISIARAILKNSPILLLDEATASLDIENELAVKQAIANLLKEKKTVVMIAHTLSIVKNAERKFSNKPIINIRIAIIDIPIPVVLHNFFSSYFSFSSFEAILYPEINQLPCPESKIIESTANTTKTVHIIQSGPVAKSANFI